MISESLSWVDLLTNFLTTSGKVADKYVEFRALSIFVLVHLVSNFLLVLIQ